ncbi:UDP-2,3-diacylglucosamine diphosphatase [Chitinilyticum piscinae]|uniref:UDP-2,3-diacylglucosamine hydrolase n=1 Tax=Chitinilyticum piscinae TaxID=2866724 RepID=A0A8J7FNX8_9NEIS|nr:UDP-2,3-diacylglucosamine diphosphatase [Chitinilyticum piscinae]MBE9610306.1 UDP-2,3-diacylglucosamine diphosphatase [Chitinilyticum piscinae]
MHSSALFIADLHLSPADPATAQAFLRFLEGPVQGTDALYILGDLFDYWLGDDQLDDPFYAAQAAALRALATRGVRIHFMPGNRDFLCSRRFATSAGLTILSDPCVIELDGLRLLLAHGDAYCTDDVAYQRFRRLIRSRLSRALLLAMPRTWRQRKAAQLRKRSRNSNRNKDYRIMDVNARSIEQAFLNSGCSLLIHGHTHRPATHQHTNGIRHVLSDWHAGHGAYLAWESGELRTRSWPAK